jgi:amino acid transporter
MMPWVPKDVLSASPIPHVLFGEAALGRVGLVAMAVISALASVTSFNAGLLTASRFLYAMARDWAAPRYLTRLHPDWATPWAAIATLYALCTAMAAAVVLTGAYKLFIFLGAAIECMIFVAMSLSVIRLRKTMPGVVREFKAPGGVLVPWIVAVVYGILFVLVFVPDPHNPADTGAQIGALVTLLVSAVVIAAYVQWLVPLLRRRAQPVGGKKRRRPGS